jgi:beta-N-acetylhexosaminidase
MNILFTIMFLILPFFAINAGEWAQQTLQKMTLDQKIGQLFMAGAYSNQEDASSEAMESHQEYAEKLITQYHVGAFVFKKRWEPDTLRAAIEHYQGLSSYPLLTAHDCEWGLSMRMKTAMRFPHNMTLGALSDNQLIYRMGREIGRQCRLVGVNYALSPVVDVNNNPANPVINDRSFGEDPQQVAAKGIAMMRGLQDGGVLASAKHFPGHGDTSVDSHQALPVLHHTRERLESLELVPFKQLIDAGVKSVMIAHLLLPELDATSLLPASLNPVIAGDLLQKQLGYQGLVITDDLIMKAITDNYGLGQAALMAFLAGNDIIMSSRNVEEGIAAIKQAVKEEAIASAEIDRRVLKILEAKEWLMQQKAEASTQLHTPEAKALKEQLYAEAITLVSDPIHALPIKKEMVALLQWKGDPESPLSQELGIAPQSSLDIDFESYDRIVVALFGMSKNGDYGITSEMCQLIDRLGDRAVVVLFGSPYALKMFDREKQTLIVAYEDDPDAQRAVARLILGQYSPEGHLPINY